MEVGANRIAGIDVDIQIAFKAEYIPLVLPHFAKAKVNPSIIDDIINAYIASGEQVSYERFFLEYCQKVINPMMNKNLNRASDHPTLNNLLRYALKEQIENDPILAALKKFKSKNI